MNLQHIERLVQHYADARDQLTGIVQHMQDEMRRVQTEHTPRIRQLVRQVAQHHARLHDAIEQHPDLFTKPKTVVAHGVRFGYAKQRGKVEMDDEQAVIARIRKVLPEEQAVLLIRVRESVDKNAVGDLTVADLKRLGITVTDDHDAVTIKSIDGEVEKLVAALLKDAEQIQAEEDAA